MQEKTMDERIGIIKNNGLCFGCLAYGHRKHECRSKMKCQKCNSYHPTILHDDNYTSKVVGAAVCHTTHSSENVHSMIVPVVVHHEDNPDIFSVVYAVLDEQSDACFVKSSTLSELECKGKHIDIRLSTILGEKTVPSRKVGGLVVRGLNQETLIELPDTYSRDSIPVKRSQIPRPETAKKWPHLHSIADKITPYRPDLEVGLLLGVNCMKAIRGLEYVHGRGEDSYAYRCNQGWGIVGPVDKSRPIDENKSFATHAFVFRTQVTEISPAEVCSLFDQGFDQQKDERLSLQDQKFMKIMKEGIHFNEGFYEMPLPFKDGHPA
ncbi:uncharacterized protein LOC106165295 [Lingula anatina]|uniref:Uncharacterized protein LOC106165295 n=1 Tax=Lingula anatina TaxID=7574 RepID=A0A1S3ILE9_LINAN|nr:uncharacterized protein LOC106165295 [Lingula anatina]|eukprot:XP_013398913.1 uncharacterized protein LOC106165295 [Lingula anatina]